MAVSHPDTDNHQADVMNAELQSQSAMIDTITDKTDRNQAC